MVAQTQEAMSRLMTVISDAKPVVEHLSANSDNINDIPGGDPGDCRADQPVCPERGHRGGPSR